MHREYWKIFSKWIQLLILIIYGAYSVISTRIANYHHLANCLADAKEPWTYGGENGPLKWGSKYHNCDGQIQSPIAISTYAVVPDKTLTKLSLEGYDIPVSKATLHNNGRTIRVILEDEVTRFMQANNTTYSLSEVHFHWGHVIYCGSEHTMDGIQYSMETHFLHKSEQHTFAVVAVFFQEEHGIINDELQAITAHFSEIRFKDMKTPLKSELNLNNLLPSNPSSFYRYVGSLTTPGCTEGVIWSLLTVPVPIESSQIAEFRKLYSVKKSEANSNCKLSDNYRPTQPLNHRAVFISQ